MSFTQTPSPRPPSPTSTSQDDTTSTASTYRKKRKLEDEESTQRQWGRVLGRLVDTYNNPRSIVAIGMKGVQPKSTAGDENEDYQRYVSFTLLNKHVPELEAFLDNCTSEIPIGTLSRHLKEGQDSSRSDDTSVMKKSIIEMLSEFDKDAVGVLTYKDKDNRGFNHPLTGRLLCPAMLDWEDEATCQSLKSGTYDLKPTDWPLFFFEDLLYDPEDDLKGLLKGTLLLWTFKCIFLGPSSWYPAKEGTSKTRRACKSHLAEMDRVTPRSIAYAAMIAYFSLSSAETNRKHGASFDLSAMFWQIADLFEMPELKEETDALLLWWNGQVLPLEGVLVLTSPHFRKIFPSKYSRPRDHKENPLQRMLAQKRAKISHVAASGSALQNTTNTIA